MYKCITLCVAKQKKLVYNKCLGVKTKQHKYSESPVQM